MAVRQKALAAMLHAGHPMDLARRVVGAAPGDMGKGLIDDASKRNRYRYVTFRIAVNTLQVAL